MFQKRTLEKRSLENFKASFQAPKSFRSCIKSLFYIKARYNQKFSVLLYPVLELYLNGIQKIFP